MFEDAPVGITRDDRIQTEIPELSSMIGSRLQLVYIVGIALNVVAGVAAAMAGDWLIAVTFGVVIVYLSVRYWMVATSTQSERSTEEEG